MGKTRPVMLIKKGAEPRFYPSLEEAARDLSMTVSRLKRALDNEDGNIPHTKLFIDDVPMQIVSEVLDEWVAAHGETW